jgi:hypothetical protein
MTGLELGESNSTEQFQLGTQGFGPLDYAAPALGPRHLPGEEAAHRVVPDRAESDSRKAGEVPGEARMQQRLREDYIGPRAEGAGQPERGDTGNQTGSAKAAIAIGDEVVQEEILCHRDKGCYHLRLEEM